MANRFYTILIVPEKTSSIKKFTLPVWLFRVGTLGIVFIILLAHILLANYYFVMNQIGENKTLKLENRQLKQEIQSIQHQVVTAERTLDRLQTLATRLKVILQIEPTPPLFQKPQEAPTPSSSLQDRAKHTLQSALAMENTLQTHYENLHDKKSFLAALPTRQPAAGYFTSGFGVRTSPYGDRIKMHEGLDIANHIGTPIHAPANGEVTFARSKIGYGLTIIINHGFGIETWYGHLNKLLVKPGRSIKRGELIALLGDSGRATGPHVHYEVRIHGYPVDPLPYIFEE